MPTPSPNPTVSQVTRLNISRASPFGHGGGLPFATEAASVRRRLRAGVSVPASRCTARFVPVPDRHHPHHRAGDDLVGQARRGIDTVGDPLGAAHQGIDPVELEVGVAHGVTQLLDGRAGLEGEVAGRRPQLRRRTLEAHDHDQEHDEEHQAELDGHDRGPLARRARRDLRLLRTAIIRLRGRTAILVRTPTRGAPVRVVVVVGAVLLLHVPSS